MRDSSVLQVNFGTRRSISVHVRARTSLSFSSFNYAVTFRFTSQSEKREVVFLLCSNVRLRT